MTMVFEELDVTTREWMVRAFDAEEQAGPYRSAAMSPTGLPAFPGIMRAAITDPAGSEESFAAALAVAVFWNAEEDYVLKGVLRQRKVTPVHAAERLALTEFNTWYVAGLAHRLVDEGQTHCQIYRASEPKFTHASCSAHEGTTVTLASIIAGHRAGYWPPGSPAAFAIPAGPGCHHTIRRLPS